jgi:hypothetical protein
MATRSHYPAEQQLCFIPRDTNSNGRITNNAKRLQRGRGQSKRVLLRALLKTLRLSHCQVATLAWQREASMAASQSEARVTSGPTNGY